MIRIFTFAPTDYFGSNCFVVESNGEYAVVDPSVKYETVSDRIGDISDKLKYVLLTHAHFDHILQIDSWLASCRKATVIVGAEDGPALSDPVTNCYLGFLGVYDGYNGEYTPVTEADELILGGQGLRVIDCPGHTKGGVSYRIGDELFVGDTVFAEGGFGRCDLPGGDFSRLEKSIIKLITRECDGNVYCGHGSNTTLREIIKTLPEEEDMEELKNNFIHDIIDEDLKENPELKIHTRFPPEPNGYLHIGSAKAIWINAMTAKKYGGLFNLRYDDTNPSKEDNEYVESIYEDLKWLGCEPSGGVYYGSDYFDKCYEYAIKLIKEGKAYVCDLNADELREYRGSLTTPGKNSPYRDRSVEENLDLFERMKNGEFPDGAKTLRAKIDMASPNINMRDPAIYRIVHVDHHRQGSKWCIYPLYDYAHPIQDALEGITHSLCSIEFENHRPLYNWVVDNLGFEQKPKQREFARLNVTHTVMSKRYLRKLVETGLVDGWDDPRMPTLCGLRRRGYTPASIFDFVSRAGVAKTYSIVDYELLEHCIREELNDTADRRIAILHPVKVVITNYPEDKVEYFDVANNPAHPECGTRSLPFTRELYIDADDFAEAPPPKFFRMKPDGEVRLMGAYIVKCNEVVKDADCNLVEIRCTADLETGNGMPADGRRVKGTIHWVSSEYALDTTVMLYDFLFDIENTADIPEDKTYDDYLNVNSVVKLENCKIEPSLADAKPMDRFQFVRTGYFVKDSKHDNVFNRIVGLKDSFPKANK